MQTDLSRSTALYERALKVLPGGVSRNAILRAGHPTYVEYGKGCRVTDLACVLIDLMPHRVGLCPADVEFVRALREWSARHGVLLVFDEVITFRSEHGGLQARYGVTPDLTALGKIIGGGFPIGAVPRR